MSNLHAAAAALLLLAAAAAATDASAERAPPGASAIGSAPTVQLAAVGPEPGPAAPHLPPAPASVRGSQPARRQTVPPAEAAFEPWLLSTLPAVASHPQRSQHSQERVGWEWEVTVDGAPAPPGGADAARYSADASEMLQELLADADDVARAAALRQAPGAAAAFAESPSPLGASKAAPADLALRLPGGWQAELVYSRNETAFGVASHPGNVSERGLFDIRVGWATRRRYIALPGGSGGEGVVQEVTQREYFVSISGLALMGLAGGAALVVVLHCLVGEGGEGGEDEGGDDVEEGCATGKQGGERARFIRVIQESGYEKL